MDPYDILGISSNATKDEIKAAYRKKCLEHHPDRPGGNADKFREINEAFERIQTPQFESSSHMINSVHSVRCQKFREQVQTTPIGVPLEDPYPHFSTRISVIWRIIFSRKAFTQSINAKMQNDITWGLSFFLNASVQFIPIDTPVMEAAIRLGRLVRKNGSFLYPISLLDFPNYPKEEAEKRLITSLPDLESAYKQAQDMQDLQSLKIIAIHPGTKELIDSYADFIQVKNYLHKTLKFPNLINHS